MKLATLKQGGRDGRLAVVSRDLTRYTLPDITTLQAALDDWEHCAPVLQTCYERLNADPAHGSPFDPAQCHSPFPAPTNGQTALPT